MEHVEDNRLEGPRPRAPEVARIFRSCNNPRFPCSCQNSVCSFFFYICHREGRLLEQRFKGKKAAGCDFVAKRLHEIHVPRTSRSLHVPAVTHGQGFCF